MTKCEYALRIWPLLMKSVQNKETLTYSEIAKTIEIHHRRVGSYLWPIKLYCIVRDLPPLTVIVVKKNSGLPGEGVYPGQERGISVDEQQSQVFNKDWKKINPSLEELEEMTAMAKNRTLFIKDCRATYTNQVWSGSFINEEEKFIIFGVWEDLIDENRAPILRKAWEHNEEGDKRLAYKESIEHIRLIEEEGYQLKTFRMIRREKKKDNERSKIKEIIPKLMIKSLEKRDDGWYATDDRDGSDYPDTTLPEEDTPKEYIEGASIRISVNAHERNGDARKECVEYYKNEYGCLECVVCSFNFEKFYGKHGEGYIHVHHIVPLSKRGGEYVLDPIKDLVPVCPNCHAMIHRSKGRVLTVKELRDKINTKNETISWKIKKYRQ